MGSCVFQCDVSHQLHNDRLALCLYNVLELSTFTLLRRPMRYVNN